MNQQQPKPIRPEIEAIGYDLSDDSESSVDDPALLYIHVEYPYPDYQGNHNVNDATRSDQYTTTLCGATLHKDKTLWYEGLQQVTCPRCLKIVDVGKRARIGKSRLDAACTPSRGA